MGEFKKENGKTRVGMFLSSLGSVGNEVLKVAGDLTGIDSLEKLGSLIGQNQQLKIEEKKLAYDLIKSDMEDLKSAREANVKIQESEHASWVAKVLPYIFDCFILLVWGSMTFYIVAKWIGLINAENNIDMTGILGIYTGVVSLATMVIQFHRGSSSGSSQKNGLLGLIKKN